MGSYHVNRAKKASFDITEDTDVQRWVQGSDQALVGAVAQAVGMEELQKLVAHLTSAKEWMKAAQVEGAMAVLEGTTTFDECVHAGRALALIKEHRLTSDEAQQLELVRRQKTASCSLSRVPHLFIV